MTRPYQKVFLPKARPNKTDSFNASFLRNMSHENDGEVLDEMHLDENIYGEVDLRRGRVPPNNHGHGTFKYVKNHVYHQVTLPSNSQEVPIMTHRYPAQPPPVPYKPHYLRGSYADTSSPPVPPRIVNKAALMQRNQLNEEYFENIRKTLESENNDVENGHDSCDDSTTSISVKIPGTERRPYWTIEDVKATQPQKKTDKPAISNADHKESKITQKSTSSSSGCSHTRPHDQTRTEFFSSLKMLKQCGWYWGDMGWEEAELLLNHRVAEEG